VRLARCQRLPWHRVPVRDTSRGHGRIEHRTLKAITVHHFGFPHTAQVLQVTRKTRAPRTRRWRTMTVCAVTSLTRGPGPPCPAGRPAPRPLGDRGAAPRSRCHLRGGHLAGPHRCRPKCDGLPGQPGHRAARPARDRSTSPPTCAAMPATRADPSPPSGSASDEPGITIERRSPGRPPEPRFGFCESPAGAPPGRDERCEPAALRPSPADVSPAGTPVQLGTGPQSMRRGLKFENGMIACIPCPSVRMTISADWSPLS
jgi:hypothetical protein